MNLVSTGSIFLFCDQFTFQFSLAFLFIGTCCGLFNDVFNIETI
jgi:hypothetical protein